MKKYLIAIIGIIFNVALLTGILVYAFTSKDNGFIQKEYIIIHEEEREDNKEVEEKQDDSKEVDNNINSGSNVKKDYQYNNTTNNTTVKKDYQNNNYTNTNNATVKKDYQSNNTTTNNNQNEKNRNLLYLW